MSPVASSVAFFSAGDGKSFGAWEYEKNANAISAYRRLFSETYYGFQETVRCDDILRDCPRS